jgi:hypothetical protein
MRQISPLAFRSHQVDQLQQTDLPHLEETIRNAGVRASLWNDDAKSSERGVAGRVEQGKVTNWQLLKAVWAGRGLVVTISKLRYLLLRYVLTEIALLLETLRVAISYFQIGAMHEIIEWFKQRDEDRAYAHLMCWALLFGQAGEGM